MALQTAERALPPPFCPACNHFSLASKKSFCAAIKGRKRRKGRGRERKGQGAMWKRNARQFVSLQGGSMPNSSRLCVIASIRTSFAVRQYSMIHTASPNPSWKPGEKVNSPVSEMVTLDARTISPGQVYKIMIGCIIPRPIAFVSTRSSSGLLNLAPFR